MSSKANSAAFAAEDRAMMVREIFGIVFALLAILMFLSLLSARQDSNWIGPLGAQVSFALNFAFGRYVAYALPAVFALSAIHVLRGAEPITFRDRGWLRAVGAVLMLVSTCAVLTIAAPAGAPARRAFELGGALGSFFIDDRGGFALGKMIGRVGASVLFGGLSLIGLVLFTETLLRDIVGLFAGTIMTVGGWFGAIPVPAWLRNWRLPTMPHFITAAGYLIARTFEWPLHILSLPLEYLRSETSFPRARRAALAGGAPNVGPILGLDVRQAAHRRQLTEPEEEEEESSYDNDEESSETKAGATSEFDVEPARPAASRERSSSAIFGRRAFGRAAAALAPSPAPSPDDEPQFSDGSTRTQADSIAGHNAESDYESDGDYESHHSDHDAHHDPEVPNRIALEKPISPAFSPGAVPGSMGSAVSDSASARKPRAAQAELNLFPSEFKLPPLTLLANPPDVVHEMSEDEQARLSQRIEQTLETFKIEVKVVEVVQGPVITRFALRVAAGVRVNRILALESELAMALKAPHVRILAPIPGQAAVGIEVPNKRANPVMLKELLSSDEFQHAKSPLAFALGKNIAGESVVCDLAQMPHLLIAGTTGSGKSVCLNGIIASLLYRNKPDKVKFVMVDPKRVELSIYQAIPHLIAPVVTETRKASAALAWCVEQMESRYKLLAEIGVRNLDTYNALLADTKPNKKLMGRGDLKYMPHIVIIIDELADLMMVARNEVEEYVIRLAQMARAVGMHLVLATQRPSVNVITGIIKANFPSRIAFQVSSKVDSRTILDLNGAEALLGRGDMLFSPGGSKPIRIQGAYVADAEVERLADYIRAQEKARYEKEDFEAKPTPAERAKAQIQAPAESRHSDGEGGYDDEAGADRLERTMRGISRDSISMPGLATAGYAASAPLTPADMEMLSDDMLYDMALRLILESRKASVSYIQRRMKIGYARAGRMMDMMEENGIVGPYQGSKPRDLRIDPEEYLAQLSHKN